MASKIKLRIGDHVKERDTGERGTIIHLCREPALQDCVLVRFGNEGLILPKADLVHAP